MALSKELQIGKAAEHLVCADLILQGVNAFLADQGLPYDVVVDHGGRLLRVQVKATRGLRSFSRQKNIYRYSTRRAKGGRTRFDVDSIDFFAFVGLDVRVIGYIPIRDMIARTGSIKQTIDFKSRRIKYVGRVYSNGSVRTPEWGRFLEDFSEFKP